jgi:hypothetical protein
MNGYAGRALTVDEDQLSPAEALLTGQVQIDSP